MIASFFRQLEEHRVEWLLISGQATILYGAATFSEDVDLWIKPTPDNFERFREALHASHGRYYKLTPPLDVEFALRHHGFHFVVPDQESGIDCYLDVMGSPPRVGSFDQAWKHARFFDTRWGRLKTLGIVELVEIKKTQRARDYPIIGRLALALLEEKRASYTDEELCWAMAHIFSLSEFEALVLGHAPVARVLDSAPREFQRAARQLLAEGKLATSLADELEDAFDARIAPLRRADRHFWSSVIDELRELRAQGKLMPEGAMV